MHASGCERGCVTFRPGHIHMQTDSDKDVRHMLMYIHVCLYICLCGSVGMPATVLRTRLLKVSFAIRPGLAKFGQNAVMQEASMLEMLRLPGSVGFLGSGADLPIVGAQSWELDSESSDL